MTSLIRGVAFSQPNFGAVRPLSSMIALLFSKILATPLPLYNIISLFSIHSYNLSFSLYIVDFTFSNSRVGDTQCLNITLNNDNANLVLTVTLGKKLMVNQGRLDLGNTVTIVTINNDDGETMTY